MGRAIQVRIRQVTATVLPAKLLTFPFGNRVLCRERKTNTYAHSCTHYIYTCSSYSSALHLLLKVLWKIEIIENTHREEDIEGHLWTGSKKRKEYEVQKLHVQEAGKDN